MSQTTEFRLPELADVVTSVRLSVWLKRAGDRVDLGEPIAEVETDKTNVELESPVTGVLHSIAVEAGTEGLEPGVVLALIADEIPSDSGKPDVVTGEMVEAGEDVSVAAIAGQDFAEPVQSPEEPASSGLAKDQADQATPLARRMAAAAGLDLTAVPPTGSDGRVVKVDVDRALEQRGTVSGRQSVPPVSDRVELVEGSFETQELTAMRRVTATRMQYAKQTVPHFYLRTECLVDSALALVARAKELEGEDAPTLTDLVIRASACALRKVPQANSAWDDGRVRVYDTVDVAVAVSTPMGLVAPVVRGVEEKDLSVIARETKSLAKRAREGQLSPTEYSGATFTISNLGMYGVESLYAIVNPPQSCILGVGAALERPVVIGNEVRIGRVMACTLSADHRALDGSVGAELLAALKSHLEQPGLMSL